MDRSSATFEQIAGEWISYHLWSATRLKPEAPTREQLRAADREADENGFWAWEAVYSLVHDAPEDGWRMIQRLVELAPDDFVLACVAAGPLEDLLGRHPYVFIDRVEQQARRDAKFRRCVSGVWGSLPDDVESRMRRLWEGEDPL